MSEDVPALLAGWREIAKVSPVAIAPVAVPRLVDAVEAVLKAADEWDADAAELDRDIARARKSPHASDHAQARTDEALAGELRGCDAKVREAITAALTGEEASDGA
jgi:hypothetical protein